MSNIVPHDVLTAVVELGITVDKVDDQEVHGLCPMHETITGKADRSPSWSVNKDNGLHNCWSCHYGGTFQQLVMDLECPNDVFGARKWIRKHGIRIVDIDDLPEYIRPSDDGDTLKGRKIISEASLAVFFRPPEDHLAVKHVTPDAANTYDVLWDINNNWVPEERTKPGQGWIFPVRDKHGVLRGWQFKNKRVFLNVPDNVPKSQALFGYELLNPGDVACFVESPIDAPRVYDVGQDLVVPLSTFGAAVSDEQMRMVLQRTDRVMFALDNDIDGIFHTRRLARGGLDKNGDVMRGWYPRFKEMTVFNYAGSRCKDPGEMEDGDVRQALLSAYSAASLEPVKEKRQPNDVHGRPAAVPRDGRRQNPRQRAAAGRVRNGAGKDSHQHLRRGRTR